MKPSICIIATLVLIGMTSVGFSNPPASSAEPPVAEALPEPPEGYRWVMNDAFSDEFNGAQLDRSKWHDHNPEWEGRPPGKFMPASITVKDGCLRIKCTQLDPPAEPYTIACGAVQSKARNAMYGYYECRMKASSIRTSSTFWLASTHSPSANGLLSLELDILESIGNATRWPEFRHTMHSNTHVRLWPNKQGRALLQERMKNNPLTEKELAGLADASESERKKALFEKRRQAKRGAVSKLRSPVNEEFHTYGCWWVDANTMHFYADGEFMHTIKPRTDFDPAPFAHPMFMNLLCETYSWEIPPAAENLKNDAINTTLYDYVRSYKLEKSERAAIKPAAAPRSR